ncbi:hypothetical protein [Rhodopseudomonas sp. BR0M22]|uniref:hypothetical protein n=1 Tax=Rhodopseudomonas sp. BR0M22 TaxID=2269369 RepID=UPI0013DF3810|nr:hypothetical protein [Rhodopseudomonas sp. BR0M22]NEW93542.1 hypothetical protein [Rhodopseudomonas sp. BR0M22]
MSNDFVKWLNDNQGVVSVMTFLCTLFAAWASGLFSALRRRPRLRIDLLEGPTLCSTYPTGKKHNGFDAHRTGISLYLRISNIGSAATSIDNIKLGYHWHARPLTWIWFRYRLFWFWLHQPAMAIEDFQVKIGDNIKFYPFLLQRSSISGKSNNTYLRVGQSISGVIYFEQPESWGGCFPSPRNGKAKIRIAIFDTFGKNHEKSYWIPIVTFEQAKKYNPSFGITLPTLHDESTSPDTPADLSP